MLKLLQAVREGESQSNRQVALLFHWLFQTKLEHCLHSCQAKKSCQALEASLLRQPLEASFLGQPLKASFLRLCKLKGYSQFRLNVVVKLQKRLPCAMSGFTGAC